MCYGLYWFREEYKEEKRNKCGIFPNGGGGWKKTTLEDFSNTRYIFFESLSCQILNSNTLQYIYGYASPMADKTAWVNRPLASCDLKCIPSPLSLKRIAAWFALEILILSSGQCLIWLLIGDCPILQARKPDLCWFKNCSCGWSTRGGAPSMKTFWRLENLLRADSAVANVFRPLVSAIKIWRFCGSLAMAVKSEVHSKMMRKS